MLRHVLLASLALSFLHSGARAEDWTEFRGPTGQGHYAGKKSLPLEWGVDKNVAWKVPVPGSGWSSPIVLAGRVYLTSAVPIEKSKDLSLKAICLDATDGKVVWATEVFQQDGAKAPKIHSKNSHASPTPVTDGKRLYVHFGHQGTAALELDGTIAWRCTEHKYSPVHGNGGTPVLVDDRLVFSIDGGDKQLLVALNKADGKTAWTTDRKISASRKFSFTTPLLIDVDGKRHLVSQASDAVIGYDPADGREIWRLACSGYSCIPRPVFGHGMVFLSSGYDAPSLLAIRVDSQSVGDVTKTHLAYSKNKGAPNTPSMVLVGDELYMVSDGGVASCLDASTGKIHWSERLGGAFSASPTHADGRVYFQSEEGVTTVVKAATKFEKLATSELKERTFACYAVADGAIFLRTETQLYRLQAK